MAQLKLLVLGAGQDVGRSCMLVYFRGRTVMLDCGMHMGYNDHRRFPDFTLVSRSRQYTAALDAVIISHFHLDHIGALPYFTEASRPLHTTHPGRCPPPHLRRPGPPPLEPPHPPHPTQPNPRTPTPPNTHTARCAPPPPPRRCAATAAPST
jgi:glyoxylase-like metal-dependent hydrolase (beta-lactamase superfamily II)